MKNLFLTILKTIGTIGQTAVPILINQYVPGVGPLISTLVGGIFTAQAQIGTGNGAQKAALVDFAIQASSPALIASLEKGFSSDLKDSELLATGIGKVKEGLVDVFNAFGLLPRKD